MFRRNRHSLTIAYTVMIFGLSAVLQASSFTPRTLSQSCTEAIPIDLGRGSWSSAEGPMIDHLFRVDLPIAGILAVELRISGADGAEARFEMSEAACNAGFAADAAVMVERSASRSVIVAHSPGPRYFSVAAVGSSHAPAAFRLTADFTAAETVRDVHIVESMPGHRAVVVEQTDFYPLDGVKSEPEEFDPDPDKSRRRGPFLTFLSARVAGLYKSEPEEFDPDPDKSARRPSPSARLVLIRTAAGRLKSEPEEFDPDPDKSAHPADRSLDGVLTVGEAGTESRSGRRRGYITVRATGGSASKPSRSVSRDDLIEWLVEVLEAEVAWWRLVTPGSGDRPVQVLEYQPDPMD